MLHLSLRKVEDEIYIVLSEIGVGLRQIGVGSYLVETESSYECRHNEAAKNCSCRQMPQPPVLGDQGLKDVTVAIAYSEDEGQQQGGRHWCCRKPTWSYQVRLKDSVDTDEHGRQRECYSDGIKHKPFLEIAIQSARQLAIESGGLLEDIWIFVSMLLLLTGMPVRVEGFLGDFPKVYFGRLIRGA